MKLTWVSKRQSTYQNQVINHEKNTSVNLYQFHCFCFFGSLMVLPYNAVSILQHARGF